MVHRWGLVVVVCVISCVSPDHVPCGDGLFCPGGTTCAKVTDPDDELCVEDEQLSTCKDAPRFQACSTSKIATGRCYDGVCLAIGCGNGRVDGADPAVADDTGEVCDDGDQESGNGCSADCLSKEICGNGIVDAVALESCDDGNFVDNDGCTSRCKTETLGWTERFASPLINDGHREGFALAYDVARNQVVLFGGIPMTDARQAGAELDDTWIWDGHGWMQVFPPASPPPRYGHAMAYDSKRQRVLMFGGFSNSAGASLGDTWEWDGVRWSARTSSVSPAPRTNHMMVYDAKRGVIVLHGGDANFQVGAFSTLNEYSDTWLWDGATWTPQVSATRPTCVGGSLQANNGRSGAGFAFDAARGVSVLFGGGCTSVAIGGAATEYLADAHVWELDANGWSEKAPASGPDPRRDCAMTFSPASKRVLLFGKAAAAEQWEWDGQAWASSAATLPAVDHLGLATDAERARLLMIGTDRATDSQNTYEWNGTAWSSPLATVTPYFGDAVGTFDTRRGRAVVVEYSGATYERIETGWIDGTQAGTFPALSIHPTHIAYDAAHGHVVVFGTNMSDGTLAETWLWNGATWTQVAGPQPPVRDGGAMTFDAKRGVVTLFGGISTGAVYRDDTWTFDGATWTKLTPALSPAGRVYASLAYDPVREISVLIGGRDGASTFDDTWTWDGASWTEMTAPGPQARTHATLTWLAKRGRLILFGGYSEGTLGLADVWEWNGAAWGHLPAQSTIFGRGEAVMVPSRDGGGLDLFGGFVRDPQYGLLTRSLGDQPELRWQGPDDADSCSDALDLDGDGRAGSNDLDCATTCSGCGDGTCSPELETCRSCPADCGACTASCGDSYCDPGESASTCAGDCP